MSTGPGPRKTFLVIFLTLALEVSTFPDFPQIWYSYFFLQ